jgi:hypothetical protein
MGLDGVMTGYARHADGVLLLYHHPPQQNAPTIMEHVDALPRHSEFAVWKLNSHHGCPALLKDRAVDFAVVVLHYSLFGPKAYQLDDYFRAFLSETRAYKIAFFQDEHHFCQDRFAFLNEFGVDCVWTLLEPEFWPEVYGKYTTVSKLVYTIPGFASDTLSERAESFVKPDDERTIDIGYRGRTLSLYMGAGALEKAEISHEVAARADTAGLVADVAADETSRIYGDDWFRFLANCKGTLGTEAGVTIFDVDDTARARYDELIARPGVTDEEILRELRPFENRIFYRTISPRHFEAAALRVCQIMYEGKYSGAMQPMVHYLPLAKDFSNWDEVVRLFRDPEVRRELTENAYRDLIASGRYSYAAFAEHFDRELRSAGFEPAGDPDLAAALASRINRDISRLKRSIRIRELMDTPFPGRQRLFKALRLGTLRRAIQRRRYERWEAMRETRRP